MYDCQYTEDTAWAEIENTLSSMPLEEPPQELYQSVMRHIEQNMKTDTFSIIGWLDVVLALFAGMMVLLFIFFIRLSALLPAIKPTANWLLQWISLPYISLPLLSSIMMIFMLSPLTAYLLIKRES